VATTFEDVLVDRYETDQYADEEKRCADRVLPERALKIVHTPRTRGRSSRRVGGTTRGVRGGTRQMSSGSEESSSSSGLSGRGFVGFVVAPNRGVR
jgi:hypothetical protein